MICFILIYLISQYNLNITPFTPLNLTPFTPLNLTPFTPFAALRARFGRQGCGFNPIFAFLYGRQGCGLNPGSSNGLSRRQTSVARAAVMVKRCFAPTEREAFLFGRQNTRSVRSSNKRFKSDPFAALRDRFGRLPHKVYVLRTSGLNPIYSVASHTKCTFSEQEVLIRVRENVL